MIKRQASSFYPHFSQAEKPEVDKFVGFFNEILYHGEPILTDFLDPGQRDILQTVFGKEFFLQEFGGYPDAEKKRLYISSQWENLTPSDYQVTPLAISYPQKFDQLSHSAVLGSLANSGVKLDTFGDILTDGQGNWQVMVETSLLDFFTQQIDRMGRVHVHLTPVRLGQVQKPVDDSYLGQEVVSSLRLDAVLAKVARSSRTKVQQELALGLVKLNWHQRQDSNIMIKAKDMISLRHFGRLQVEEIAATKKGKYRVVLRIWQKRRKRAN